MAPSVGAAIIGDGSIDTGAQGGAGRIYGVIGTARAANDTVGDKAYGGWFKSFGFNASAPEVGLHAEVSDALANATIFEGFTNGVGKFKFDGLGNFYFTNVLLSPTAPTIAAGGCGGAAASIVTNNGTAAFSINVGTTPTTACTVTLPTATNGWNCTGTDITTQSTSVFFQKQTATGTTSATITNFNTAGTATNLVASDIMQVNCFAR
jgi:hypothetical protein